jgi:outer membrane protein OmpA-like peptidoglycan-associated protein
MKYRILRLLPFLLAVSTPLLASASEEDPFLRRPYLFGGGDVGYAYLSNSVNPGGTNNELKKDGVHTDVKLLLSYAWQHFSIDAGAGWMFNYVSGDSDRPPVVDESISTRSAILEFSPRYRFNTRWSAGLVTNIFFGTDAQIDSTGDDSKQTVAMLGATGAYVFPWSIPLRLTLSYLTDLNISDRQLHLFLVGFQFGLPLVPHEKPTPTPTPAPTPAPDEQSSRATVIVEKPVAMQFDLENVYFAFDSAKLGRSSEVMLEKMGSYLAKNPDAWDALRVEGHCDIRGSWAYNQSLSERRAASVVKVLLSQGVAKEKIQSKGFSFDRPLVNEKNEAAYAKNRRVEFHFERLENPMALKEAIEGKPPK